VQKKKFYSCKKNGGTVGRTSHSGIHASPFNAARADALGVLLLLLSAKESIAKYCDDEVCDRILDECIAELQARHVLSAADMNDNITCQASSFEALLRILDYLKVEVTERFHDPVSGDRLGKCIAHLMTNFELSPERLYAREAFATH
jgi:hypothetical protein